jgi:hypothetical protein
MNLAAAIAIVQPVDAPTYELERRIDGIEIRRCGAMLVAEARVEGPAEQAGNQAFPILAGYLFGRNRARIRMPMRSPVTQVASGLGFIVQFVLPAAWRLADAPDPTDPRIRLRQVPARRVAAVTYSGRWTDANYAAHLRRLTAALQAAGLAWVGEPIYARYNAPFTLWILRRNEIWLALP